MAEEQALDKKKVETIKLLLSSLFARKQKYLVLDGKFKNRLIYANFPYERTIYYRPTPEDTVCGVTVNDSIVPILYEAFPLFGEIVAEISLQPFMSTLNKCLTNDKTKWPTIEIVKEDYDKQLIYSGGIPKVDNLIMIIPAKGEEPETRVVIGRLLPPDAHVYYEGIMSKYMEFTKDRIERDFEIPEGSLDEGDVILKDFMLGDAIPTLFKFPLRDGISLVSFKEYLKKRNFPIKYNAIIQYRPDTEAARIALGYKDDWVDALSIMPGTLWFPFRGL